MQPQLQRVLGDAEEIGGLARRALLDVAQEQHRAVALGQLRDRRPHLRSRLAAQQRLFRRRRPGDDGPAGVVAVLGERRQHRLDRLFRLAPARPQLHQRGVHDDAVQPRGELGVAVEGVDAAEGGQERVLDGVPRQILVVQEAAGDGQHAAAERAHDGGVRVLVTGLEAANQVDIGESGGRNGCEHVQ